MTSIWTAADAFSDLWIASPHTKVFRRGLEPTPHDPTNPLLRQSVHDILVVYTAIKSQPMLLGKRLTRVPEFEQLHSKPEVAEWFDTAQRFAFSLVELIEFLRSRLPGYPTLLVPDLLPSAPRVYRDGFWDARFPWEQEVRTARLQFANEPAIVAQALELPNGGREAYEALTEIVRALRETETWTRFAAAHEHLTSEAREEAKAALREYRDLTKQARIDAIAGSTGMRSGNMRRSELERLKGRAQGALREYYDAFDEIDELIDAVAAFISHRVAEGEFDERTPVEADWGPPRDLRTVRVKALDNKFLRHGYELIKLVSPIRNLSGVVVLRNTNLTIGKTGQWTMTVDGWLLVGSSDIPAAPRSRPDARR